MINKIIDAVLQMKEKYYIDNNYQGEPQLVLLCSPKKFQEIKMDEISYFEQFYKDKKIDSTSALKIAGIDIPIILRNDIPEDVDFYLLNRKDYERISRW